MAGQPSFFCRVGGGGGGGGGGGKSCAAKAERGGRGVVCNRVT